MECRDRWREYGSACDNVLLYANSFFFILFDDSCREFAQHILAGRRYGNHWLADMLVAYQK